MEKLIRRCAQCRQLSHRSQLYRLQLTPTGEIAGPGAGLGRSLYFCQSENCLSKAARNKSLPRLLPGLRFEVLQAWCQAELSRRTEPRRVSY